MTPEYVRAIISLEVPFVQDNMRGRLFDIAFFVSADLISADNTCNPESINLNSVRMALENAFDNTEYRWDAYKDQIYTELMYRFLNDEIKFDRIDKETPFKDINGRKIFENDYLELVDQDTSISLVWCDDKWCKKTEDGLILSLNAVSESPKCVTTGFFEESGFVD